MAELTTASSAKDFLANYETQVGTLQTLTVELSRVHAQANVQYTQSKYASRDRPDKTAFEVSFSVALAFLATIVNAIVEGEEVLEMTLDDDEPDDDEISHANGELFAQKTMYLSMLKTLGQLETSRLHSTCYGMPTGEFMVAVGRNKAVPRFDDYYARSLPAYSLTTQVQPLPLFYRKNP